MTLYVSETLLIRHILNNEMMVFNLFYIFLSYKESKSDNDCILNTNNFHEEWISEYIKLVLLLSC